MPPKKEPTPLNYPLVAALSAALAFLVYLRSTGQGFWDPSYNSEL